MNSRFRHIGIIGKPGDDRVGDTVNKLIGYLSAQGMQVCVDPQTAENFPMDGQPGVSLEKMGTDSDLIMVVGGDGTLLGAARSMAATGVPLLGINLGRLGFLVDISPNAMTQTLDQVLAGEYEQERRFLLEARIGADDSAMTRAEDEVLEAEAHAEVAEDIRDGDIDLEQRSRELQVENELAALKDKLNQD